MDHVNMAFGVPSPDVALQNGGRIRNNDVRDADNPEGQPGRRVWDAVLNNGTVIVMDGEVLPGPGLNVATLDFLAGGGDRYPFGDAPYTRLGVPYQQALSNYVEQYLGGVITASLYPEGGEGRITILGP